MQRSILSDLAHAIEKLADAQANLATAIRNDEPSLRELDIKFAVEDVEKALELMRRLRNGHELAARARKANR